MNAAQRLAIAGVLIALLIGLGFYVVPIMAAHSGTRRSGSLPWWMVAAVVGFSLLSSAVALIVILRRRRQR